MADNGNLTAKQYLLIDALIAGHAINAAARIAGINESTAHRWLKREDFQAAYKQAQSRVFRHSLTALMNKVDKAINTLDRCMDESENNPTSVQVRAAIAVLEQAIGLHHAEALEQRVDDLERQVRERIELGQL